MKRLPLATALFAALAFASLHAQTIDMNAKVPFDFRMGETLMPAGEYVIHHAAGLVALRGQNGVHAAAMNLTLPASRKDAPTKGALEFNRYGDSYFLAKIWAPDSRDGRALIRTKREKELASRVALTQTATLALTSK
jgi:hypothetical protein